VKDLPFTREKLFGYASSLENAMESNLIFYMVFFTLKSVVV